MTNKNLEERTKYVLVKRIPYVFSKKTGNPEALLVIHDRQEVFDSADEKGNCVYRVNGHEETIRQGVLKKVLYMDEEHPSFGDGKNLYLSYPEYLAWRKPEKIKVNQTRVYTPIENEGGKENDK